MKFKCTLNTSKVFFIAGLITCLPFANAHADREFTATAQEHIPTAIQQIAQTSVKSLSAEEDQDSSVDGNTAQDSFNAGTVSEAFGHLIVKNLENPGFTFDLNRVIKGMEDQMKGLPSPLTDEEYEEAIISIQEKIFDRLSEKNLKEANEFLQNNANADGIVQLIPGKLQYKIEKEGSGAVVQPHSTPLIHYVGKYLDGTVFGSSKELDDPISLPLDQTIPGFSQGLLGMKEGEKRILYVHPDLGYGTMGQLPPNSLLIFEVDLIKANVDNNKNQSEGQQDSGHPTTK